MPSLAVDSTGAPIQAVSLLGTDKVSFTGTSVQSLVIPEGITLVRITTTENCFIEFGANPTATTTSHYFLSGLPDYFRVVPGTKLAFLQETVAGTAYISYTV